MARFWTGASAPSGPPEAGSHDDAATGAAPVVVIGHDVWQRRFAGARDVIGRELRLGEDVHTVVGVTPDGVEPAQNGHRPDDVPAPATDVQVSKDMVGDARMKLATQFS